MNNIRLTICASLVILANGVAGCELDPQKRAMNDRASKLEALPGKDLRFHQQTNAPKVRELAEGMEYKKGKEGHILSNVEAAKRFRIAADAGNIEAQAMLGGMYLSGLGVAQDFTQAFDWLQKSATKGNPTAESYIGAAYLNGVGLPEDKRKAAEWLKRAADQGHIDASAQLASLYEEGSDGLPKDVSKAIELYKVAARSGNPLAQANLASLYLNGESVTKDVDKAIYWAGKSADQDHTVGHALLGMMYSSGEGLPKDEVLAYMHFYLMNEVDSTDPMTEAKHVALDTLNSSMSPENIEAAKKKAVRWRTGRTLGGEITHSDQ